MGKRMKYSRSKRITILICVSHRFVYQANKDYHQPTIPTLPQLPPKISHQPILPPKIPIIKNHEKGPELPPKIKLENDREIHRTGPTTDGKMNRIAIYC